MTEIMLRVNEHNDSIIPRFIDQILENRSIQNYLNEKSIDDRVKYKNVVHNLQVYSANKTIYFRLRDVAIILGVSSQTAKNRIKAYTEDEGIRSAALGKSEFFLTDAGVIKFIYQSRTSISNFLSKIFTNIILDVCGDPYRLNNIVKKTIENNPDEAMNFFNSLEERCSYLTELYEIERERNGQLECENRIINLRLRDAETRVNLLEEDNSLLEEVIEKEKYEKKIMQNSDFTRQLMEHYMTPLYVHIMTQQEVEKCFDNIKISKSYLSDYEFSYKHRTVLENDVLGYKITDKKSKSDDHIRVEYVHGTAMFAKLKEEIAGMLSLNVRTLKGPIMIYGRYAALETLFMMYQQKFPVSNSSSQ